MNGAVPSNGNIKIGCGAEDVELEFREMTVHTDGRHGGGRIDLFTDAKRSKAKGPIHMSSTGAVDPRSISEVAQQNYATLMQDRRWTDDSGKSTSSVKS